MDVDNFFYGIQAAFASIIDTLRVTSRFPMFMGFVIGFLTATIIHAMLTAEHVRHVPAMVLKDPAVSFQKVYPPASNGTFDHSYLAYEKNVQKIKTVFYAAALCVIILLMLATLAFK